MDIKALRALSNDKRLLVMEWLKDPVAHFPSQVWGDLVRDGVCGQFIAEKLGVSAATASVHLNQLADAGLLQSKKIKQWVFYRRDEKRIALLKRALSKGL
ncbi:MAG: transcriptional regulator [Ramlibacter sp.]|nr:transcriptional regulator [Ramlibacter sp.]